jgi:hypothetical protein
MENENLTYRQRYYRENKQKLLEKHQERTRRTPLYSLISILALARKRAEVTINQHYLLELYDQQQGLCALSGIKLTWATGKMSPTSLSVDRIDNSKGYIPGNVRLVCVAINAFRGTMNDEEMLKMARALIVNMESAAEAKKKIEEFV